MIMIIYKILFYVSLLLLTYIIYLKDKKYNYKYHGFILFEAIIVIIIGLIIIFNTLKLIYNKFNPKNIDRYTEIIELNNGLTDNEKSKYYTKDQNGKITKKNKDEPVSKDEEMWIN